MKEHFCPAEQSVITYQYECSWCGESEGGMIETIKDILKGIDQTGIESSDGWWETSTGAKFGAEKLKQILELLAQTQEPVAWIHNFIEGGISIGKRPADLNRHPDRWTALYKDPKPCQTCEALARTVMLDQTSHDTIPPQRTWVGLTDEEIELAMAEPTLRKIYHAIEAKLKEKNNGV
jgi:hypothetical protein